MITPAESAARIVPGGCGRLVAAASGYASESAFTAMFRAAMGQPPSHFSGKTRHSAGLV